MNILTVRQLEALEFIRKNQRTAGPTLRELAAHLGVTGNAAMNYVKALRLGGDVAVNDGNGLVLAEAKNVDVTVWSEPDLPKADGFVLGKRAVERLVPVHGSATAPSPADLRSNAKPLPRPGEKKKARG